MLRYVRSITLIQWLAIGAILATLAAILLPPVKWASDGQRDVTILVHVFDASTMQPFAGVEVTLILGPVDSPTSPPPFDSVDEHPGPRRLAGASTNAAGNARVTGSFPSIASHLTPKGLIGLQRGWLVLRATGYEGVAVPVRHESMPRPDVVKMGEVPVHVGLLKAERLEGASSVPDSGDGFRS